MTLKKILEKAALLCGVSVDFTETGTEQSLFLNAARDVLMRLSGEYCTLKHTETLSATGGAIPYSSFTKTVKRVLSVQKNGEKAEYEEESAGVRVDADGAYEVTYAYLVDAPDFLHDVDVPPRYNLYLLALGVAGEYCYFKGMYEEGRRYEERFLTALNNVSEHKSVTLKAVRL